MPTIRTVKSFVWSGRDIDAGEVVDVSDRDAFLLVHAYGYAVRVDEAPAPPAPSVMVTSGDPAIRRRR